jgi:putative secretion ATPase (PEP-CTERM system associated)
MYETFYGLRAKPFQLNPDPAFFFESRGHKRAFAYLQYGVHQSEGFIVITGDVGAGKTTLVRSLFEQLDRDSLVAAQIVSTQLDADDMLRSVAAAFGLPMRSVDKASLLASLEAFLCKLAIDQRRALLVVDEAQNLTPRAIEELRMLSNFQLGQQALLQSFLIGQPELRHMMQGPHMQQLRQRVIASYHLGPLDKAETQAYVEHRLAHVGWTGDPTFDAKAFQLIHDASGGIPRRINTLCNRLLIAGFLAEKHVFEATDVDAIVREIRDELGPKNTLPGMREHSISARNEDAASEADPESTSQRPTRGNGADHRQDAPWLGQLHEIEQRIERLEKAVNGAVGMLHTMLRRERSGKPGSPANR